MFRLVLSLAVAGSLAVELAGCGYGFTGGGRQFAPELRTISVRSFENRTREVGIEKRIAFAIEREFGMRGPLRVVNGPADGDLVISGRVWETADRPVAFNRNEEALVNQAAVSLDVELRRRDSGALVWQGRGLRSTGDYESVAAAVITTSPEFRGATLNAGDLGGFTDIQLAESRRQQAIERIVGSLARDVYERIMEDF